MKPQSLIFPTFLFVAGVIAALHCAWECRFLWAAVFALVAAIGWHERRQTALFNQDLERLQG